jgi:hypothetical protein
VLRAGGFGEGAVMRWRFGDSFEVRTTYRAPTLTVEYGSERLAIEVRWFVPLPGKIERPHFRCQCGLGCYHLYWLDGTWQCRRSGHLDYAVRHIGRHTPQLARLARLRRKLPGAGSAPFSDLPPLRALGPKQRRLVGQIIVLERGVLASMGKVADALERRAKAARLLK